MPIIVFATILISIGTSLLSAAIVLKFRGFHHIIPHIVRLGLYISPVAYPASLVDTEYRWLYYCNPVAGLIEGARWSMFQNYNWSDYNYISFGTGLIVLLVGLFYFTNIEGDIADSI